MLKAFFSVFNICLIIVLLESQKIPILKVELWTPPQKTHTLSQKVSIMNIFVKVINNNNNNKTCLKMFYLQCEAEENGNQTTRTTNLYLITVLSKRIYIHTFQHWKQTHMEYKNN